MNWFVIRTKPRQEQRAGEHISNQAFQIYCPWLTRDNGKKEPLFPGYIFVRDVNSEHPFNKIRSTRGVLGFVRFGAEFARASDQLISNIQLREQSLQNLARFSKNDRVRLKSGPFAEIEAIYQCKSGSERSIILLDLLSQKKEINVRTDDLQLA